MAAITLEKVNKIFDDGTHAVSDLSLEISDGEFLVLVGPSGCGKTTALRMVAGLESMTDGEIWIGERLVNDLHPRARDVAMVFQNYALYPHMTVYENIGFGLRARRVPRDQARVRIEQTAQILGLSEQLRRKPAQLSGGQRQRVAMGRAIVREPQAFLMDEPLSNLDAKLRVQMRAEISRIQREFGVTTMYVTHDQVEAMTMGDRVAVMRRGLLQQLDEPQRLYDQPANLFVASFIGSPAINLLEGLVEQRDDSAVCHIGAATLPLPAEVLRTRPGLRRYFGRPVAVGFRPESIGDTTRIGGARLHGIVQAVEALGPELLAYIEIEAKPVLQEEVLEGLVDVEEIDVVADIKAEAAGARATIVGRLESTSGVRPDVRMEVTVDSLKLHFFDLDSSDAIRD
jgi:multiple sugar transport system ATP-binding protein